MDRHDVLKSLFLSFTRRLENLEKNNELEVFDLAYCEVLNKETRSKK